MSRRPLSTGTTQSTALRDRLVAAVEPRPPSEHVEAVALAYWVRSYQGHYPELENWTQIPNQAGRDQHGGKGGMLRQVKMMAEGLSPGYPDNILDVARGGYHGLRVELKKAADWNPRLNQPFARSEPSAAQKHWHQRLAVAGYCMVVTWGWEAARDVIQWYIHLPVTALAATVPTPRHPPIPRVRQI